MACVKRSMAVSHSLAANALFPWAFNNCRLCTTTRAWSVAYPQKDGKVTRTSAMADGDGRWAMGDERWRRLGIGNYPASSCFGRAPNYNCALPAFSRRFEESSRISWNCHRSRHALRWLQDGTRVFVLGIGVLSLCPSVDSLLLASAGVQRSRCDAFQNQDFQRNFESLRLHLMLNKSLL